MSRHPLDAVWNLSAQAAQPTKLDRLARQIFIDGTEVSAQQPLRKVAAPRKSQPRDFVDALANGLAVLDAWHAGDTFLKNHQIAERTGLTRSTVTRITAVLECLGYVARCGEQGLRLGSATLTLGYGSALAAVSNIAARETLSGLARELDVYAALGLRCGDKIQIIENVVSPFHPDAVVNDVGAMLPICRSASGMAAISALPEQEVSPLFAKLEGYYGPRWTSLQHRIESKRREYHQSGYCTSLADLSANVGAVAIPILPTRSGDIFVLACGMQAREFHADRVNQLIAPRMLETAQYFRDTLSH